MEKKFRRYRDDDELTEEEREERALEEGWDEEEMSLEEFELFFGDDE